LGVSSGLKNSAKAGNGGGATTTIGGIVETALVLAIVAEAGAAAYIYRDQINEFIQSYSSNTQISNDAPLPEESTLLPEFTSTELPEVTETPLVTFTTTSTTVPTIIPTVAVENNEADVQAASTPDLKENNGNHFGQTPKPERTKDKGNNDDDGDQDKDKRRDR
jgi:hypothetical protein